MVPIRGRIQGARFAVLVATLALATAVSACSHKSPFAPEEPGEPEVFFNWLSALLSDQGQASQPAHEFLQWLDDQSNYPVPEKRPELAQLLQRLGNATQIYRQTGAFRPTDEPILDAIDVYIAGAQAYVNQQLPFSAAPQLLERDEG